MEGRRRRARVRRRASFSSTEYDTTSSGTTSIGTEDPRTLDETSVNIFDFSAAITVEASETSEGSNFWSSHFFSDTTRIDGGARRRLQKRSRRRRAAEGATTTEAATTVEHTSSGTSTEYSTSSSEYTSSSSVETSVSVNETTFGDATTERSAAPPESSAASPTITEVPVTPKNKTKSKKKKAQSEKEDSSGVEGDGDKENKGKGLAVRTDGKGKRKGKDVGVGKEKDKSKQKNKEKGKGKDKKGKEKGKGKEKSKRKRKKSNVSAPLWVSRASYADVLAGVSESHLDFANYALTWGDFHEYKVAYDQIVGAGAFGEVCLAVHRETKDKVVMKIIKPDKMRYEKIQQEVKMLELVSTGPNIVRLLDLVEDPRRGLKMLVFECIYSPRPSAVFARMTDWEARNYLFQVLTGLLYTHSIGIMHRDIKTGNVLYDPKRRQVAIIDWGLAEFYRYDVPLPKYPGTKSWKAPELLLRYPRYDYGVDMWAFGCLMGQVLFSKRMFIRDKNDDSNQAQFQAIIETMGTEDLFPYLQKYRIKLRTKDIDVTPHSRQPPLPKTDFQKWKNEVNSAIKLEEGADLIDKILVYDHEVRATAEEAVMHPYFNSVRNGKVAADFMAPGGKILEKGRRAKYRPRKANTSSNTQLAVHGTYPAENGDLWAATSEEDPKLSGKARRRSR